MSHKNYSAKPLDYVEPTKKKLVSQGIDVAAIERENAQVTKHVEDLSGLQVSNSEILLVSGNINDITDYSHLPTIGNTTPSVQDISEYNPVPKPIKPNAPKSSTVQNNEVIEIKKDEEVSTESESVEEKVVLPTQEDITETALTEEDATKEVL